MEIFNFFVSWVDFFLSTGLQGETPDTNYTVTTDNVDDDEVRTLLKSINLNRGAVENIKMFSTDGSLKFLFNSKGSIVFIADDCEVLKFYKDNYNAKLLSDIEYGAYHDLMHLPNIPMMHGMHVNDDIRFLALDHCGIDGMEMFNRNLINYETWKRAVFDLGECLDDIHALNRVHGDIKIENITWDGDQWYFIDFGLGYSGKGKQGKHKFCGTFPNILPVYGLQGEDDNQVLKLPTFDRRRWSDYYAFALTMLSLAGVDSPGVDCNPTDYLVKVYVERIYRIATDFHPHGAPWEDVDEDEFFKILKVLANVVLTQLDHTRKLLIWDPKTRECKYHGENKVYLECKYSGPKTMWDSWSNIYKESGMNI